MRITAEKPALPERAAPALRPLPIEVNNLTVSYQGRPVLRSVSFHANSGEMVGIVGPNGAGKSTLMKAILGLIPTDHGSALFFREPIDRIRRRVAYVPQTEAVDWDFPVTVRDVVLMGRYGRLGLLGRPSREDRTIAAGALEQVGMEAYVDRHIRHLSGGQQKRVFLARALCQQADVLLLDEPFAGVDASTEQTIFELIADMTRQHKTLLVVNHDLSVLGRFAQLLMLNQRVIAFGPTEQVATSENLAATYGGRLSMLDRAESELEEVTRSNP